jgi:hypothetical protein
MAEPSADRVDVDARAQEMDRRRMPDEVRADALEGDGRNAMGGLAGCGKTADEGHSVLS